MRAAVEDVHHRHRQHRRVHAAEIAIERNAEGIGRSAGAGHRDREDGIGAQAALVPRAVERDHGRVDQALIGRIHAGQFRRQNTFHVVDGMQDTAAEIMRFVAVAQLHCLMFSGRGAARHRCPAHGAAIEDDIGFYCRISA